MTLPPDDTIEGLLAAVEEGRDTAFDELVGVVYTELLDLAGRMGARRDATLRPTALVHEVFLRLARGGGAVPQGREHLLAVCAKAMRQILADHARRKGSLKRGGHLRRVTLDEDRAEASTVVDAIDLDTALDELARLDPRQAEIVELRYLGGMTNVEIAGRLGIAVRTVELDLQMARTFLRKKLVEPPNS